MGSDPRRTRTKILPTVKPSSGAAKPAPRPRTDAEVASLGRPASEADEVDGTPLTEERRAHLAAIAEIILARGEDLTTNALADEARVRRSDAVAYLRERRKTMGLEEGIVIVSDHDIPPVTPKLRATPDEIASSAEAVRRAVKSGKPLSAIKRRKTLTGAVASRLAPVKAALDAVIAAERNGEKLGGHLSLLDRTYRQARRDLDDLRRLANLLAP